MSNRDATKGVPGPTDQVPPMALDAEGSVLCACFDDDKGRVLTAARGIVAPEDFYSRANRLIFATMCEVADEGRTVDPVAVATRLNDKGKLKEVGGTPYIYETISLTTPAVVHVEEHAWLVRDTARLRRLIAFAIRARAEAYAAPSGGNSVRELLATCRAQIEEIAAERTADRAWPVLNVAALFAPLEPIHYIVAALDICAGAPTLIGGYGFTGKTVTAQSLAISVCAGLPAWGTFACHHGRVLHIDYEQGARVTRERYQRLAAGLMVTPDDLAGRLEVVSLPSMYLDKIAIEATLVERCAAFDLVIIDSLRAACPTIDENDSKIRIVLDMLTRVSERTGACIIVIHHARKPSMNASGGAKMAIRGSGAIFDACGSVLVLEAEKGEPTRISHEKARVSGKLADDMLLRISDVDDADGVARGGLVVSVERAPSREQVSDDASKATRLRKLDRITGELRALFEREPEQGGADAIAAKIGRHAPTVRAALKIMVADGLVSLAGNTSDRRHQWVDRE